MARKRNTRSTGAFVLGGVVGGVVGAAVTLWNTPKSGEELRAGMGGNRPSGPSATVVDTAPRTTRFDNPVLSFVERAAAPIVGVELGKLAKDDAAPASVSAPASPADRGAATDPEVGQHVATMEELTRPQGDPPPDRS